MKKRIRVAAVVLTFLVVVVGVMAFSANPIATIMGGGQQPMATAAYAQPMDNNTSTATNTTKTITTNNILNNTRDIDNTTLPGETVVYRGILTSEHATWLVLPLGVKNEGVGILPHRQDGAVYTGVLTFTATEPVEVGFGHTLPIDNATLSRLEANETSGDFYGVQQKNQTDTPGLLSVPSVIVPEYGTRSPYFSASIPFAADSVWLRTSDGEPFIVVYEIIAEIHQPEAVVVDIK